MIILRILESIHLWMIPMMTVATAGADIAVFGAVAIAVILTGRNWKDDSGLHNGPNDLSVHSDEGSGFGD